MYKSNLKKWRNYFLNNHSGLVNLSASIVIYFTENSLL